MVGMQAGPRDGFPVFNDPTMLSASAAERVGAVRDQELVIGIARDGVAKAYPVAVMGIHELGNDTIAGVPIAVGW
jgi:hypothetical protein